MTRFLSLAAASLLLAGFVGCGSDDGPDVPATHKVTGTVTLDGKPLAKGNISFESEADTKVGISATGEISDGKFEVLATVGKKKVKIRAPKEVGEPDATGMRNTVETIPPKYNEKTTLEFEVKEGENKQDFALKSK